MYRILKTQICKLNGNKKTTLFVDCCSVVIYHITQNLTAQNAVSAACLGLSQALSVQTLIVEPFFT